MLDMVSKGRHWKKLTSDQIETIRKLRAEGKTIKEIAELTEFSKTAINKYMRTKSEKEEE